MNKQVLIELREEAKKIVSQMTLEEKVLQTLHNSAGIDRLGIKAYNWWNEALHGVARAGVATVFPQAIGLAATFDEDLIEQVADVISTEGRGKYNAQRASGDHDIYKGITFWSPNVNIFRDPRWGRGHETFGEDPYLSGRLGVRFIHGLQGKNDYYLKSAACAKHFAVHSGPEDQRHHFDAVVNQQDLRETYLPAFKDCVKKGDVEAIMGAYNRTNGEACCGSKTLLHDILRDEWGFEGHVLSDCWAIKDFHEHHKVTKNSVESVAMAMNNGCDLNCGNQFFYLEKAVKDGLVSEERLDEAVVNLYTAKLKLGILPREEKNPYDEIPYDVVDCPKHQAFNLEVAKKTLVLLKNENNILPLDKSAIDSIGIIGPNANNRKALIGNYEGTASRYYTITEGIQEFVQDDLRVYVSEGCHLHKKQISGLGSENDRISEVKAVCQASDVIIACLGLDAGLEGEEGDQGNEFASGDKANLLLPGIQQEVLETIMSYKKPTILVLLSGSALAVDYADEHVPGIIQAWYPGAQGGKAIASAIFGETCFEGKLPVTYYRENQELPPIEDYSMAGRTYRYMKDQALYPFGFGLSYSSFELGQAILEEVNLEKSLKGKVSITNTGSYDGSETLQIYVSFNGEDVPNYQLKYLKKVFLLKGESKELEFELTPDDFGLFNKEGKKILRKGNYKIYIGTCLPDSRSEILGKKKPREFSFDLDNEVAL